MKKGVVGAFSRDLVNILEAFPGQILMLLLNKTLSTPAGQNLRQNVFSSLMGVSPPASSAFSDEINPRRVMKLFYQESALNDET